MKRLIAMICVVLTMAAMLCACSEEKKAGPIKDKESLGQMLEDLVEDVNEFKNDNNYLYEAGAINIRPRHMYWEGDVLVAECFISSGLDTVAYNLKVEELGFENEECKIASGAFGLLEGASVAPYTHITWTFRFSGEAVENAGADLTGMIGSHFDVSYSH